MPGKHNFKKMMGYKDGGSLREPTNKGLASLPTEVRNKMGFMKKGGKPKGYMYGGKVKKMASGGTPGMDDIMETEEYKKVMKKIGGKNKADRTGESTTSGSLAKGKFEKIRGDGKEVQDYNDASTRFKASAMKADEVVNTKRDLGGGARMTLKDKKTSKPMSGADKERGLSPIPKRKKNDPQTTAKNKAKMNPPTFKASQEGKGKDLKLSREINVKSPKAVATYLGGVDRNPRKNREGFESDSKYRKMRGMKSGGKPKAYGMKHGGQACRGGGKATRGTKFTMR